MVPDGDYPAMSDNEADAAFTALAADLLEEISAGRALQLVAGLEPPRSRDWRTLSPRQLSLADNHDLATPDRPGRPHCAYCGRTGALADGPDAEWLGDKADKFCSDERACIAARERRYPPDPSKVPPALMDLAGRQDDAEAARAAHQQAVQQQEPQSQQPESQQQPVRGLAAYGGWYDRLGQWHAPAQPQFAAYAHTLMNPVHRSHLLSGQSRPHYYAGPGHIPMAVYGSEGHEETSPGQQGSQPGIPAEGLPDGVRQAIEGRALAADIPVAPAAAAMPQRPVRSRSRRTRWR